MEWHSSNLTEGHVRMVVGNDELRSCAWAPMELPESPGEALRRVRELGGLRKEPSKAGKISHRNPTLSGSHRKACCD